jgi:hypothetical protein
MLSGLGETLRSGLVHERDSSASPRPEVPLPSGSISSASSTARRSDQQFSGGGAIRQSGCSALAVDCDSKSGTDLFHPQVTETAEPFDQNTG